MVCYLLYGWLICVFWISQSCWFIVPTPLSFTLIGNIGTINHVLPILKYFVINDQPCLSITVTVYPCKLAYVNQHQTLQLWSLASCQSPLSTERSTIVKPVFVDDTCHLSTILSMLSAICLPYMFHYINNQFKY